MPNQHETFAKHFAYQMQKCSQIFKLQLIVSRSRVHDVTGPGPPMSRNGMATLLEVGRGTMKLN
jgi:hypothetical protein